MDILNKLWITDARNPIFSNLFREYFNEFGIHLKEDTKTFDHMNDDMIKYNIKILVMLENQIAIGFSMFQVDTKENPWCMCEGAGDIREFYIKKNYRQNGYARHMFMIVKEYFEHLKIKEIYLTADEEEEAFWVKIGFDYTGIINPNNKSKEFVYRMNP